MDRESSWMAMVAVSIRAFIVLPTLGFLTLWLGGRLVWEMTGSESVYHVSCGCAAIIDIIFNISDDYALKKWWCLNRKTYLFND
ncbi:MAG: hypothetical protein ACKOCG_01495 [Candidatus Nanopelagicus sp.]